jgi:hypothetical protein
LAPPGSHAGSKEQDDLKRESKGRKIFLPRASSWFDKRCAVYDHVHAHVTMKTERVTLLTTKEFKSFLRAEAKREGVSVAELVRVRCEHKPHPDEVELGRLTAELREALRTAKSSLKEGLSEARSILAELRSGRLGGAPTDHPQLTRRPGK